MHVPIDANPLLRPRPSTAANVALISRRVKEFPYTPEKARGRIALATGDMQPGEIVGALDLSVFHPMQLRQDLGTTCFYRSAINLAMAFGSLSSNPYLLAKLEGQIADEAMTAGLLDLFGAKTQHQTPARMEDFLQLYTHLNVRASYPHGKYPDTQLVNALRDGNAAIGLVYRSDLGRQEWEAFYAVEKTADGVLFHSAFSGDGHMRTRTGQEMAQALYGTTASPELWFVEVQTPFPVSGAEEK